MEIEGRILTPKERERTDSRYERVIKAMSTLVKSEEFKKSVLAPYEDKGNEIKQV